MKRKAIGIFKRSVQAFGKPKQPDGAVDALNRGDFVGGMLLLAHGGKMRRVEKGELQEMILHWRSTHIFPSEIRARDQVFGFIGPVISSLDLGGMDLSKMDLRRARFQNCNFHGCKLNNSRFEGAFLFGCDLSGVDSWVGCFQASEFRQCYVVGSRFMYGHFEGGSFIHSNLEGTKLIGCYFDRDTWFHNTRLYRTNLSESRLEGANLAEARTLYGATLHLARLDGAEIDYDLFGGVIGEELDREFTKAAKTYMAIKANLESRGYSAKAGQAHVKERQMIRKANAPRNARRIYGKAELGDKYEFSKDEERWKCVRPGVARWEPSLWSFYLSHTTKWISDCVVESLCSYGESVWRVLFWMIATILVIGPVLIAISGGLEWTGNNWETYNRFPTPLEKQAYVYLQYILYLIDAFTTANFSNVRPANDIVRLASGMIALSGIFLAGLLGFVAGNRIRQS